MPGHVVGVDEIKSWSLCHDRFKMLSFYNKNLMEKGCLPLLVRSSTSISGELCKKHVSGCIVWFILLRCAKHPLTSSVWRWFRLSFCKPFSALDSSARNHATRFPCSSVFQNRLNKKFCLSIVPMQCYLQFFKIDWLRYSVCFPCARRNRTHDLPCRKCTSNDWYASRHWGGEIIFLIYCRYRVKKGKIFETLRQNNAVLSSVALSERDQRRTELVRGYLASHHINSFMGEVITFSLSFWKSHIHWPISKINL